MIGERVVNHVPSRDRDIAMVFQSYALYPHLTVYENIAFGLRVKKVPKDEIDTRVKDAARILELEALLDRKPRNLSGGQRQRVAMGRAIVRHPQAFLMDEPLSNLDAKLRVQTRAEIAKLQHDLGVTTLYVTHDQVEALTMGDRVAVMQQGRAAAGGRRPGAVRPPAQPLRRRLHRQPGDEPARGEARAVGRRLLVRLGSQTLALDDEALAAHPALNGLRGARDHPRHPARGSRGCGARGGPPADRRLKGKVELTEALGSEVMVHFSIDAAHAVTEDVHELQADIGDDRAPGSGMGGAEARCIVGRFGPRSRVQRRRRRSRSPSTRARFTSSIPRPLSGSTTTS